MAILVVKVMTGILDPGTDKRLERSCGRDWIRRAPAEPGIERIEAFFTGHAYDPHRHDTYAIGFTVSGVQSFDYRGSRADSRRGNVIVLHPDEVHDGRAGIEQGFRYRMIYIEPRLIAEALADKTNTLPFMRSAISSDPRLLRGVTRALVDLDCSYEPLERDRILTGIADALLALDTSLPSRGSLAVSVTAVDRARAFLDAHFTRTVTSEELEAITGLDRYGLARHFRARLGTSPYRYLTMRRLDHAKADIAAGRPLAEAALVAGFADQSHMTRRFKQAFGLTPGRWQAICH